MLSLIPACLSASLVDCFGDFFYFGLPIGLLWVTALALPLIPACFLASLSDCFGAFADSSLPIGFFRVTALALSLIPACLLASFGWLLWGFRWFQLVSPSLHIESVFAVTYNQQLNPTNSIHPVLSCQRPIPAGALQELLKQFLITSHYITAFSYSIA